MGRACRGKERSDWQHLCKIAELAEITLAVLCAEPLKSACFASSKALVLHFKSASIDDQKRLFSNPKTSAFRHAKRKGGCGPRHSGVRSAVASAMRDLCKICVLALKIHWQCKKRCALKLVLLGATEFDLA